MSNPTQISSIKHMFDWKILMKTTKLKEFNKLFQCSSVWSITATTYLVIFKLCNTSPPGSSEILESSIAWPLSKKSYGGCSQIPAALFQSRACYQMHDWSSDAYLVLIFNSTRGNLNLHLVNILLLKSPPGQMAFFSSNRRDSNLNLWKSLIILKENRQLCLNSRHVSDSYILTRVN